jgi:hypothetical protein
MFLREIIEVFIDKIEQNGAFWQLHPTNILL